MKTCKKCGLEKPDEMFRLYHGKYRSNECRDCKYKSDKEWLAKRKLNPPERKQEAKRCNHCQEVKPISEFSPSSPGYFAGRCKACIVAIHREKRREQSRNDAPGLYYWPFENEEGIIVKHCINCHVEKPLSEFYTHGKTLTKGPAKGKKRPHSNCKDCDKALKKADYDANPEKYRKAVLDSARRHPDRTRARWQRWHTNNQEHRLQYLLKYHDRRAEVTRIWGLTHPEKRTDSANRRRARQMNAPRVEKIDRKAIIERDKWTCYICGQICTPKNVTLDHVIPLFHGGSHTADNLRVACYTCNCSKGTKLPHEFLA